METPDLAHRLTDKELAKLERRIYQAYREAAAELEEVIRAYFEGFKERDKAQKKLIGQMVNGRAYTEEDYKQWRLAQIGRGERFEALRDRLAERYVKAYEVAIAYVNDDMAKIYAMNRTYAITSAKDQTAGALDGVDFILYDEHAVKRLIMEEPDLMPYYPKERAARRGFDLAYGKKQITAAVTSGILQGKGIDKIAKDLMERVPGMLRPSALRAARTAVTEAENAGRQAARDELEKHGVVMGKRWLAANDNRTRHAHASADGQIVKNGDPFTVGGEKLRFPGDESLGASGWNIYNCRCVAVDEIMGFTSVLTEEQRRRANIRVEVL